jgi:hypothetical protein
MIALGGLQPQAEEILTLHIRIRVVAMQGLLSPASQSCFVVLNVHVLLLPALTVWVQNLVSDIKGRTQIEGV